uniref:Uncharacterized protein n=1 Tax=Fagus sylvatica TaxID=28930 RepID=A0A2N9GDX8_FAGSY
MGEVVLASWFRLKYPHVALGALASSAPILYFDAITPQNGYLSIVTKDFREASETCYQTILKSWSEIDKVASEPHAQYNHPPSYPVTMVCSGIDGAPSEIDILSKIFAGVVAYFGNSSCYVNGPRNISETIEGWSWQRCSEMVIPIGCSNDTMFPPDPFNLSSYTEQCNSEYGVPPRPHWVTTYFGGHVHIDSLL